MTLEEEIRELNAQLSGLGRTKMRLKRWALGIFLADLVALVVVVILQAEGRYWF